MFPIIETWGLMAAGIVAAAALALFAWRRMSPVKKEKIADTREPAREPAIFAKGKRRQPISAGDKVEVLGIGKRRQGRVIRHGVVRTVHPSKGVRLGEGWRAIHRVRLA